MKKLLLLLLLFLQVQAFAQREANNWYFGDKAGLNFSKGYPVALTDGALLSVEATATMSDAKTGELLFYTNGVEIWNRKHQRMPNGKDLLSNTSSTQGALIIPFPNHPQQYLLFCVNASVNNWHSISGSCLTHSVVNMNLAGGLGDIEPASKNTSLVCNTSEKLTAVPHTNGKDYWVITHGAESDAFYVFLVTEKGVSEAKTIHIGHNYHGGDTWNVAGYLKASPNGKKLACAVGVSEMPNEPVPFEIFDFDAATGTISNAFNLGSYTYQYGVSFSPDNSKLYLSGISVIQFDLSLKNMEEVRKSAIEVTPESVETYRQSLQLGPDGRMYNKIGPNTFYVFQFPDNRGLASAPELQVYDLKELYIFIGLPNFLQSYFNRLKPLEYRSYACVPIVEMFPNPTTGKVKFMVESDCAPDQHFRLQIFNAVGQQVVQEQAKVHVHDEVDLSAFASGLYLLVMIFPDNQQLVKKVVRVN